MKLPVASPQRCFVTPTTCIPGFIASSLLKTKSAISARILCTFPVDLSNLLSILCLGEALSINKTLESFVDSNAVVIQKLNLPFDEMDLAIL